MAALGFKSKSNQDKEKSDRDHNRLRALRFFQAAATNLIKTILLADQHGVLNREFQTTCNTPHKIRTGPIHHNSKVSNLNIFTLNVYAGVSTT